MILACVTHCGQAADGTIRIDADGQPLEVPQQLDVMQGSISFWVHPLWSAEDGESHTLLSGSWSGADDSYLVISAGWWEPAGADFLYFVLSNQDRVHCKTDYRLPHREWSLITVTWADGTCELYVDVRRHSRVESSPPALGRRLRTAVLGDDSMTSLARGRVGNALYAHVRFFDAALDQQQVQRLFDSDGLAGFGHAEADWRWLQPHAASPPSPRRADREVRAIFDEGHHWGTSREETNRRLDRIARAGFDIYVPTLYYGRGTYFPSSRSHQDRHLSQVLQNHDPVLYLVQQARARGIEVHGSFTVAKRADRRLPGFFDDGTPDGAFNVHNPEFRSYIVDLMVEAAERYHLDGLNLDYIRAMGICNSAECARSYHEATGRYLRADIVLRHVSERARRSLSDWQEPAVTAIVADLRQRLAKLEHTVTVSVCFNSGYDTPVSLEGRSTRQWLEQDLIDLAFDMQYRKTLDVQALDDYRKSLTNPDGHVVLFANYDRTGPNDVQPREPHRLTQIRRFLGGHWPDMMFALYLYNQLTDEQIQALAEDAGPRS